MLWHQLVNPNTGWVVRGFKHRTPCLTACAPSPGCPLAWVPQTGTGLLTGGHKSNKYSLLLLLLILSQGCFFH